MNYFGESRCVDVGERRIEFHRILSEDPLLSEAPVLLSATRIA